MRITIRVVACTLLLLGAAATLPAQDIKDRVEAGRIDLAVPDNPAFNIIGGSSSEILRPSSLREVSVLLGDMFSSNPVSPKATAFEISPMLLASNPTLDTYAAQRWLYSTRVSFATSTEDNGARQLSFGIRISLIDETDLRTNDQLLDAYRELADLSNTAQSKCFDEIRNREDVNADNMPQLIDSCVRRKIEMQGILVDSIVRAERTRIREASWNSAILEIGAAGAARSSDSLVANLMSSAYSFWATWAQPVFGPHGQLLIGLRGASLRGADNTFGEDEAAAALRCYVGSNDFKGFLEFDFLARSGMTPVSTGALGIELNLSNGIWIDGSAGLEKSGSDATRITGGVNLRLATPEVKL